MFGSNWMKRDATSKLGVVHMITNFDIKLQVFLKEFPWLLQYIDRSKVCDIKASRVSSEMLHRTQRIASDPQEISPSYDPAWFEQIILLDDKGGYITNVGHITQKRKSFWQWHSPNKGWEAKSIQTISDALLCLGDKSGDVFYVVTICDTGNRTFLGKDKVVVYKPPKGFNLKNWLFQVEQAHSNALRQQLSEIDKDGIA